MTAAEIKEILRQGSQLGTLEWVYFEGGEPFLYYPVLTSGVSVARSFGFRVGVVTNAYWATSEEDAITWLKPLVGKVEDLSISCDMYHANDQLSVEASNASSAAGKLGVPVSLVSIAQPEDMNSGLLDLDESPLRYRGRAAEKLAKGARLYSWKQFDRCPHEELREPARVHIDPFGHVHICQGLTMGNLFTRPLKQIVEEYEAESHPLVGLLLEGGPAALTEPELRKTGYADACHLCFSARKALRERFPDFLGPAQMYGVEEDEILA
jgi:MoaA/NifB/PqqE/SkfB family radical SAM enzyme